MIAKFINELLKSGQTFQSIADIMGVTYQTIQAYLYKGINPKVENLVKLAEHFNVSIDYILGYKETPEKLMKTTEQTVVNKNITITNNGNGYNINIKN